MLAPEVITISDLISDIADRVPAGRVDQLLRLYNVYRAMLASDSTVDFDSFRGWGETVLAYFTEVDMYGVPADEIFKNVKDYRDIASNFLTEEQKLVIEEYFGRSAAASHDDGAFWRTFGMDEEKPQLEEGGLNEVKKKFLYLWRTMAPLYHALNKNLAEAGLSTNGGMYRHALDRLREMDGDPTSIKRRKLVFVGFNALSHVEGEIFSALAAMKPYEGPHGPEPYADFWWDATGPVLTRNDSTASRFVVSNRRRFPHPKWSEDVLEASETDTLPPVLRVIAAPSGSIQAKIISEELRRMQNPGEVSERHFNDARVAVVLPDEGLLLPLLYSLPENIGTVNLTMGYPLRLTSTISFVGLLRRLQMRQRRRGGETVYGIEDVEVLLAHPYIQAIAGSGIIQEFKGELRNQRITYIGVSLITKFVPCLADIIRPLCSESSPAEVIQYLRGAMESAYEALGKDGRVAAEVQTEEGEEARDSGSLVKLRLDQTHIRTYLDALRQLDDSLTEHGITMHFSSVFSLADRLLAGETVNFEGEPLEGLQVMGLLETRAIDFDRLIIPSLNERILPMKARARTFIPESLRVAFGMPPANFQESLFAYYFFRMISRADEVVMLYDARSSAGMRSGDVSRYLLQLKYLYATDRLIWEDRRFKLEAPGGTPQPVRKTERVMELLHEFQLERDGRNLSASALRKYMDCPTKFYYEVVVGLRADDPPARHIDSITQGNIIHDVMMRVYLPDESDHRHLLKVPKSVTRKDIIAILNDSDRIERLVRRAINSLHLHRPSKDSDDSSAPDPLDTPLEGESAMVVRGLCSQIERVLRHDLQLAPFDLYGTEVSGLTRLEVEGVGTVNIKYAIDRVDRVNGTMRIVDYKTGRTHLEAESMEDVLSDSYDAKHIFQLMLYAGVLAENLKKQEGIRMEIYEPSRMPASVPAVPQINRDKVMTHNQQMPTSGDSGDNRSYFETFRERVDEMVREIFDREVEFKPCENEKTCEYCNLASLCKR